MHFDNFLCFWRDATHSFENFQVPLVIFLMDSKISEDILDETGIWVFFGVFEATDNCLGLRLYLVRLIKSLVSKHL